MKRDGFKKDHQKVRCCDCGDVMDAVYCRSIRTTCEPCGGAALGDSEKQLERRKSA